MMQNQSHNILDTSRIGGLLAKLTMPMFFGMLVQNIYNVVDTIFIGHYVGSEGIAALSIVFPLQMLIMGVGNMIGIGGGSLVSRLIGGRENRRAELALGNSLCFSIILSLILTAVVLPSLNYTLIVIGASETVLPLASTYLIIIFASTVINVTNAVLLMMVRAEGNTRVPMISLVLQSLLNIGLDWLFIVALNMGVAGAAIATVISQVISLGYILSYYLTSNSYLKIRWANFKPDMKIVKDVFAIGVTQFAQTVAMTISAMFFIRMAVDYGGDMALAAFGIIQRIMLFASMPGMVLGQAMQPILGYNYGAKRYGLALKVIYQASIASTVFSLLALAVLMIIPEPIILVFTSDTVLVSDTIVAVRHIFSVLPLFNLFNIGQLVFPSIGKVWESLIIAIARPAIFLIPLVFILPLFWQMNGVWSSFPGSDTLGFLLVVALMIPLIIKFRKADAAQRVVQ